MTRKGIIEREKHRAKLNTKYYKKIILLKNIIKNNRYTNLEKYNARMMLQNIPRNASLVRKRNRCLITGRPRGTFRRFKLSRFIIRELAFNGYIPGIFKASW